MKMKVITLTLNPAYDLHCYAESFSAGRENLARMISSDAGGKGVNISRALLAGGVDNTALVVLGDENGDSFAKALRKDGLSLRLIGVEGRIRENITVHTAQGTETRLSFSGFSADESLLERVFSELDSKLSGDSIVTFTGRVPEGISATAVKGFLEKITSRGARLVIDSKSVSLADIIEIKPWLIKPNGEEISEYLGRKVDSFEEVRSAAEEIHLAGVENVMVSLGEQGAMLICPDGGFVATPPRITPRSTIGAGDSTVAGFIAAQTLDGSAASRLALAVAYGTAACLTEGTKPLMEKDISEIFKAVSIKAI